MFLLSVLIMGVFTFAVQSEERMVAAGSCRFHGRHPKTRFMVEGEPLVMRCPQVLHWESTSAHVNVTWHRNDSAVAVPGEEESRVWVQDGALWIVPASQADSGTYICTVRNASYCDKMSVELRVFEKTEASVPLIFYPQIIPLSASGLLVCPDLSEFIDNKADVKIQWYKDSVPLDQDSKKFLSVRGTRLLVNNVSMEDAGYYTCAMTFAHKGRQYNITRNIKLQVKKRDEETIPVIISPHQTISASLGSRLTIPCKVFLGAGIHTTTLLWWTANNTLIDDAYHGGRVTEGERQAYSENNENYLEVPLIFDPVRREDLHTDFKCVVRNTMSFQTLRTTVKEAATFSWEIMLAPLFLIVLVLGGIWMHRRKNKPEVITSHQPKDCLRMTGLATEPRSSSLAACRNHFLVPWQTEKNQINPPAERLPGVLTTASSETAQLPSPEGGPELGLRGARSCSARGRDSGRKAVDVGEEKRKSKNGQEETGI